MDREAFGANLASLNDQAVRDQQRQSKERQRRKQEKSKSKERRRILAERYKPFNELSERNVSVIQRASYMIDACGGGLPMPRRITQSDTREAVSQVSIILGDAPQSELTPNHKLVCMLSITKEEEKIESYSEKRNGTNYNVSYDFDQVQADFDFYYVANNFEGLLRLKKNPMIQQESKYFGYPAVPEIGDKFIFAKAESTFPYREDDDTPRSRYVEFGNLNVSERKFNPINALKRIIRYGQIVSDIENLEDTMDMIEQAARNSVLNRALCSKLAERDQMSPSRIAATATELFAID